MFRTPFTFLRHRSMKSAIKDFLSQDSADFASAYRDLLRVCRIFLRSPITLKEATTQYFDSQYATLGRVNREVLLLVSAVNTESSIRFTPDSQDPQTYLWYQYIAGSQFEITDEKELWLDLFSNLEQLCLIVQETESVSAGYYEHIRRVIYLRLLKTEISALLEELQKRL